MRFCGWCENENIAEAKGRNPFSPSFRSFLASLTLKVNLLVAFVEAKKRRQRGVVSEEEMQESV